MVTRREIGFLAAGAAGVGGVGYLRQRDGGVPSLPTGNPMTTEFRFSEEFDAVRWRDDAWIEIHTAAEARGESLALAFGDVEDPLSGDSVTSNMTERGEVIEFGLSEVLATRSAERVSIASYRRTSGVTADRLDTVTAPIPEQFR